MTDEERQQSRQAKLRAASEDARKVLEADVVGLMSEARFRKWAFELIWGRCGLAGGSDGALVEGRRQVGRELLQELQALSPDLWREAVREAADRDAQAMKALQALEAEEK